MFLTGMSGTARLPMPPTLFGRQGVNGVLGGEVSLFIDFEHPAPGLTDRGGLRLAGRLEKSGDQMAIQNGTVAGNGNNGGVPASNLAFGLVQA